VLLRSSVPPADHKHPQLRPERAFGRSARARFWLKVAPQEVQIPRSMSLPRAFALAGAPRVIALCGRRRCGKDTAAALLLAASGERRGAGGSCTRVSFADPLKAVVRELFGLTHEQTDGEAKDAPDERWGGTTPRRMMQFIGTDVMQYTVQGLLPGVGRLFWVHRALDVIDGIVAGGGRAVVTDLRFHHECAALRARYPDVVVVRITRRDAVRLDGGERAPCDTHLSETECDSVDADVEVHNDGTIGDLHGLLEAALQRCGVNAPTPVPVPVQVQVQVPVHATWPPSP
jgi:hypothetical protein